MSKLFLVLVLALLGMSHIKGQSHRRVKTVINTQTFYLDKASTGNKNSRSKIEFVLPSNTVQWFYSVGTQADETQSQLPLNLIGEVTSFLGGTAATIGKSAIEHFMAPKGVNPIDIWVTDETGGKELELRDGLFWAIEQPSKVYWEGTRSRFLSGNVFITDKTHGLVSLVFNNRNLTRGVSVTVQIGAIVNEDVNGWSPEIKNQMLAIFLANNNYRIRGTDKALTDLGYCYVEGMTRLHRREDIKQGFYLPNMQSNAWRLAVQSCEDKIYTTGQAVEITKENEKEPMAPTPTNIVGF